MNYGVGLLDDSRRATLDPSIVFRSPHAQCFVVHLKPLAFGGSTLPELFASGTITAILFHATSFTKWV